MLFTKYINRFSAIFLFAFLACSGLLSIVFFDGTGDAGDSVLHYLFARYAPAHPALFFDHWAKPVFVLLASPFAQFGFVGIKVFNALVVLLTIGLTYRSARLLNFKNSYFVIILMGFAPLYYLLTFSGLTEPLFALFVAMVMFFSLQKKYLLACIILSFMPLVRSEGLIILGVYVLFLLVVKQWKFLPLLLCGSVIYSVVGYPFHHDWFWVFTKIPYSKLSSTYGSGELFHYVKQLLYVVGIPIYLLFCLGLLLMLLDFFQKKCKSPTFILIVLVFGAFFTAHSLFWYLGIFNSMGLNRVLICVMPCIALIALYGFSALGSLLPKWKIGTGLQVVFTLYILVFPFTSNPAAIDWKTEPYLNGDQKIIHKVGEFVKIQKGNIYPILCTHPYLSEVIDLDHFDTKKRLNLSRENLNKTKKGSLIVWENWFAVLEENVTQKFMDSRSDFIKIQSWSEWVDGSEKVYIVYRKK